jgi:hypothetical protein
LKEQERAMVRIPILAMVLWFAVTGMARAQTGGQANPQAGPASPTAALLSPDTGSSGIGGSSQSVCSTVSGCDPLSVPTSAAGNTQAGSVSASAGAPAGMATGAPNVAASPSTNPESAQQLPGEAPNAAAANSAKSTASATGSYGTPAAASPPLCGPTMQTTTGESLGVFSGILPGGC